LGRLSFHAKAHPYPMYASLEAAAKQTGRKITLVQCGWFANEYIEAAFRKGAQEFAPSVKHIALEGRNPMARQAAWAMADIFITLADNIQETFGLTPLEAMAAGKPVIASDWDGYRETVVDGESGFLIPSFIPSAPLGEAYARNHASGAINYDHYIGLASQHVSFDLAKLTEACVRLIEDPDLRAKMGSRGLRLAREVFDWSVVMRQYRSFWDELAEIRKKAESGKPKPAAPVASMPDPYALFAHYPNETLHGQMKLSLHSQAFSWKQAKRHELFRHGMMGFARDETFQAITQALQDGPQLLADVASTTEIAELEIIRAVSLMAKWGELTIS
jgi:hypothetical protein